MDNANVNNTETKTTELTPELKAQLDQIQANQEKLIKKEKKTTPIIVVVIVLLLISLACMAFTFFIKGKNNDGGAGGQSQKPVELSEIKDVEVINKLNERFDAINMIYYGNGSKNSKNNNYVTANLIFTKNRQLFSNLKLTDNEKRFIVAAYLSNNEGLFEEKVTKADYTDSVIKALEREKSTLSEEEFVKYGSKVSAEKFAAAYKELFGEDVKHKTLMECGGAAFYDAESGYYYSDPIGGCGGFDERYLFIVRYGGDYQESENNYYLDVHVTTVFDGHDNDGKSLCAVFDGYYDIDTSEWSFNMDDERVARSCKPNSVGEVINTNIDGKKLAETEFRYTFDKEFHFKKIERL